MNNKGLFNVKSFRIISASFNVELNFMKKTLLLSLLVAVGLVGCGGNSEDDKPNPVTASGSLYYNSDYSSIVKESLAVLLKGHNFTFHMKSPAEGQFQQVIMPLTARVEPDNSGTLQNVIKNPDDMSAVEYIPYGNSERRNTSFYSGVEDKDLNVGSDEVDLQFSGKKLTTIWAKKNFKDLGNFEGSQDFMFDGSKMAIVAGDPVELEQIVGNFYKWKQGTTDMYILFTMYENPNDNNAVYLYRAAFKENGEYLKTLKPLKEIQ